MEIIAVDDDPILLHTIAMVLEESFGEIGTFEHPERIQTLNYDTPPKVIILDLNFTIGDSDGAVGLAWIRRIKDYFPHASIIILTAHGFLDVAVKSLKQGATDFLEKPFTNEKLISTVQVALNLATSQSQLIEAQTSKASLIDQLNRIGDVVLGKSASIEKLMIMISKVATTDASVLITGEHGTGKEVISRLIHQQSARASEPFVISDLSSITNSLFESTMLAMSKVHLPMRLTTKQE